MYLLHQEIACVAMHFQLNLCGLTVSILITMALSMPKHSLYEYQSHLHETHKSHTKINTWALGSAKSKPLR
jgi:hypothetical protein